jgi:hypothetical protein
MSDTDGNTCEWAEEEYEKLFASIGKYVVFFQLIEARVDELLLLAWGHENWEASQRKLVGMPNEKKIQRLASEVLESVDFRRVHTRPDWVSQFKAVVERLHIERKFRNSVVHSQILFEFAEKGLGPPLLSYRTKQGPDVKFDRSWLTTEFQTEMVNRVAILSVDMGFVYTQLLHDFQARA